MHDPVIKEQIILGNLRLVPWIAYKYALMYELNQEELESYGYEGLIEAVDKFDFSMGFTFTTYAVEYIKGYIKRAISIITSDYQHRSRWASNFVTAKRIVEQAKGVKLREDSSLAYDITKLMVANGSISECDEKDNFTRINLIISESLDELQDKEIEDSEEYNSSQFESSRITRDLYSDNPVLDEMERKELRSIIEEVLSTLTPREADVMKLRYGFVDGECWSLKRIGKHYGVTQERISQIEVKAIIKIRFHSARIKKIIDYKNSSYDPYNSELPSVIDDIKKL